MKNLEGKTKHYTYFLKAPMEIRSYSTTTNWMERLFKELKDYLRIRGFFQNELSAEKFLYVFFKDKSERYENRSLRYSDIVINFLSSPENRGVL